MGIFIHRNVVLCLLAAGVFVGLSSHKLYAQNKFLENLEAGQVVSSKSGASVLVQSIVNKEAAAVIKAITEDLTKLPKVFPQIAFARAYKSQNKNLLYLKMRGLGDGTSALVEYKQGPLETFTNAREFLKSGDFVSFREPLKKELEEAGDNGIAGEIQKVNDKNDVQRLLGSDTVIEIEGPLYPIAQFPALRMSLQLSLAPYTVIPAPAGQAGAPAPTPKNLTLFSLRAAFGNQVPRGGDLGSYRGFGDREVSAAQQMGEDLVRIVKARLEKI